MKFIVLSILVLASLNAFAGRAYPRSPEPTLTPGALCTTPDSYRYPEQIPYCDRALNSFDKEAIIMTYRSFGYSISGERSQYKIDHFIPLCVGGSNDPANLWPQYFTISRITDPLEKMGCDVLAAGKMPQKEVVDVIVNAKNDLTKVPAAIKAFRKILKR